MAGRIDARSLRQAANRSNTKLLLTSVMLFQAAGMLLLTFKRDPPDTQALLMAVLMPLFTWLSVNLYSALWRVDRALMILVLFLCSVSLITLEDIARSQITPLQQAYYILAGLVAMACGIVLMRNLRRWEKWVPWLIGLSLVALALPLLIGKWQYGAKNWIGVPGTGYSVQPSEFVKPALILTLAAGMSNQPRFVKCLPILAFAAALCGLLLAERDLGALLLYFITTAFVYYAATSNLAVTLAGFAMGAGGAYAAYRLFPYVAKRVEMFVNPWSDPLDKGWQIIQALIAIGSGGLFGMGLGLGYPRNIPLYHSDFIFSAICEEFGLIFAVGLIAVYVLIALRGASVAMNARASFHALTATGVTVLIGLQAFVIIGGNVKLLPLTGVTLPFVSAGGSSMISMMGAAGLLLGVSSINAHDEAGDIARMAWRETRG